MEPTRRCWTLVAIAIFLAGFAVVLDRPLLLAGTVAMGGWVLARQYRFLRAVTQLSDSLVVESTVARDRTTVEDPVRVELDVRAPGGVPLPVRVEAAPPVAAVGPSRDDLTLDLAPGKTTATTVFDCSFPVAGVHRFDRPTVTVTSATGLFRTTFARGDEPTITVEPNRPRDLHVGEGGERIMAGMGEHVGGRIGPGFEPAEVREYQPGDPIRHIDWKATARLDHPHVQEFEAETDRVTALLIDHRAPMAEGPAGETKLDYAREIGLGFVASARQHSDPLGLYTVGDEGLTARRPPEGARDHYDRLRGVLGDLTPTASNSQGPDRWTLSPAAARGRASALADESGAFARTLGPYFAARDRYVHRLDANPLFGAARLELPKLTGSRWTVLITDDTDPAEVHETVSAARRGNDHVLVFLLPSVLFEPGGLSDLEAAYAEYLEFESFRRDLAAIPRVSAFEVGPGDRLAAVLDANRRNRTQTP